MKEKNRIFGYPQRQEKKKTLMLPWSRNLTFDDDSRVFVRAWVGPVPRRYAGNGVREGGLVKAGYLADGRRA